MGISTWEVSAIFWRNRSNAFEVALRKIEALNTGDPVQNFNQMWEIAFNALNESKKPQQGENR